MIPPSPMVVMTTMVAMTLGRMWRSMTLGCPAPRARAASMYWFSTTLRVALRMTRDAAAATRMDRDRMTLSMPGPITARSDRMITRYGKDCQASTTRWTAMS